MSKDNRDLLSNEAKETSNLQQSEESGRNYGSSSNSNSNLKVQHLKEKEENTNNDGHKNQLFQEGIPWEIYVSRALSAWGDRIWDFSLGIFMNLISPESLRLVAIQGFIVNISVIIFGSFIGNWIDRNPRLLAAKIFLSIQNIAVAIACAVLVIHFTILSEKVHEHINYSKYYNDNTYTKVLCYHHYSNVNIFIGHPKMGCTINCNIDCEYRKPSVSWTKNCSRKGLDCCRCWGQ